MTWLKYDYVCGNCDSLIEITTTHQDLETYCICAESDLTLMSVVDVTIDPTKKKEEIMESNPYPTPATINLTFIEDGVERTESFDEDKIRSMHWANKFMHQQKNENYLKENKLRSYLADVYSDEYTDKEEVIKGVANIMDIGLTKEVEVTFNVQVTATVEIDLALGDDFDITDFVKNNITLDSYDSAISITGYDIENVERDYF